MTQIKYLDTLRVVSCSVNDTIYFPLAPDDAAVGAAAEPALVRGRGCGPDRGEPLQLPQGHAAARVAVQLVLGVIIMTQPLHSLVMAHGIMGRRFPDGGLLRYRK